MKDRTEYFKKYREAHKVEHSKWMNENKERVARVKKEYALKHREKTRKYQKGYHQKHKEEIAEKRKDYFKQYYVLNKERIDVSHKVYSESNRPKRLEYERKYRTLNNPKLAKKKKERYYNDIFFNLKERLSARLRHFLKHKSVRKYSKTMDMVGCTPEFLKKHLEDKFSNTMNWYRVVSGEIHIDHIIPLCSAKTEEEMYKLFHYSNLQPLWAVDNIKKGGKLLAHHSLGSEI